MPCGPDRLCHQAKDKITTSPFGGATIKTMNNNETVNNVLASLYESLSDEAREMMLEVFREEDGE